MTPLGSPQALTLEQVLGRRHKLLVDWAPSLVLDGGRELMEMVHKTKLAREEQAALVLFMEEAVEGILGREAAWFNDDDRFQSAVHSMLGIKQGVAKLPTDGILDLSRRDSIVSLPESIGGLGALEKLYLRGCTSLASLPEDIGGLGALKELNLYGCTSLASLPEGIGGLGALKELDLCGCTSLASLPEGIGGLGALKKLDLDGCSSLVTLPKSLTRLRRLKHIDLSSCSSLSAESCELVRSIKTQRNSPKVLGL
jgi:hypothetical protein